MRIFLILILFYLVSCSSNPFDDDIPYKQRFDDGLAFFEEEKYGRAAQQFNIIVQRASHTDLGDDALFFLAESYYLDNDYDLALLEYEKLVSRMGFSPYIEKARWRICESLMGLSPNYYHDQDSSRKAIIEIQQFLDDYPKSEYSLDADKLIKKIRLTLARKNMETGELYVKLKAYDSAMVSYKIVTTDYYDTEYYDDANLEIIRCLVLMDKKDEAKLFLNDLTEENESLADGNFKELASKILNDPS
ncbi:MAG: outer membrane protein assembly factor BamD [Candidatus Neomarinimicrobiota bacterium]|nr:outer membrane protein assembly factor BamD [Candidatus Neomarinimicrobiota bacterium]